MPRKPRNPKDSAQVKGKKLQAMATMALAIKSELDALQAATPLGYDYVFRINVADLGHRGLYPSLTLTSLETAPRTESGLILINGEVLPLSRLPVRSGPIQPTGSLIGDAVRYLPILLNQLEATGVLDACLDDSFASRFWTTKNAGRVTNYKVPLREALLLLNKAIPLLVERQGLGYSLNEGLPDLINAYLAVLAHALRGKAGELVLNWKSLIADFQTLPYAKAFHGVDSLARSDTLRKRAGAGAEALDLLSLIATRRVQLSLEGIQHFQACADAAKKGRPLPSPFS